MINKLKPIKFIRRNNQHNQIWLYLCDCGKEIEIRKSDVNNGNTKSCGCLWVDRMKIIHTSHGMSKTNFYKVWNNILERCFNKKNKEYKNYGARGIKVCERWLKFENFRDDMYFSYKKGFMIERIDNNREYSKKNCRWATQLEQANNKTNNHFLKFKGIKKTIAEWSRELNINYNTIKSRANRGYSIDKILSANKLS